MCKYAGADVCFRFSIWLLLPAYWETKWNEMNLKCISRNWAIIEIVRNDTMLNKYSSNLANPRGLKRSICAPFKFCKNLNELNTRCPVSVFISVHICVFVLQFHLWSITKTACINCLKFITDFIYMCIYKILKDKHGHNCNDKQQGTSLLNMQNVQARNKKLKMLPSLSPTLDLSLCRTEIDG